MTLETTDRVDFVLAKLKSSVDSYETQSPLGENFSKNAEVHRQAKLMTFKNILQKPNIEHVMFICAWLMVFGMPWSSVLFRFGLYGFVFCFLLSGKWREKWSLACRSKVFLGAATLSLIAITSLSYTIAPMNLAWIDVSRYSKLLMVGTLMFVLESEKKRLSILLALAAGIAMLMLPTILDGSGAATLLHIPLQQFANQAYGTNYLGTGLSNLVYWRNQIAHGFFVSILFFICLCCAVEWKRYRFLLTLLALVCVVDIIFFIDGRMALLSLVASLMLFAFLQIHSLRARTLVLVCILGFAIASFYSLDVVKQRIESIRSETLAYYEKNEASTSAGNRLHYWKVSFNLFNESKLIGAGAGAFRHTLETTRDQFSSANHSHTHNEYLTALSQYGLLGLAAFLSIFVLAFRNAQQVESRVERHSYQAVLVIFSLNCLSDSMLYNQDEGWTLVFVLALIAAAANKQVAINLQAKSI